MKRERRGLFMGFAFPFLIFAMEMGEAFAFRRQAPWMGDIFHTFTFNIFTF